MQVIETGSRDYQRILLGMLLGSLVTFAILYSPQTLIHTFAEQFHVSPSTSSMVVSSTTITLAFSMLFVSVYSNYWGRKKIMAGSLLISSLLNILAGFSPNFQILIVVRILQGIALGGFPAVAMTYLNEELASKHIGRVMGIYVGGSVVGAFVGRLMVSALTDLFLWEIAVLALGLFSLTCSLLFIVCLPESRNFVSAKISIANWALGMTCGLKNPKLLCLYGMGFIFLGVYVALFNYISFPLSKPPYNLSQTMVGFLFIIQLAGSWSSYTFGKLTEGYSRPRLIGWAIAMTLAGAWMTLSSEIIVLLPGLLLFASGFLASHTIASGWIGVVAKPGSGAYASSLYLLFYYSGSSLIGWLGGVFLNAIGWHGVIIMVCGLLAVAGLLSARLCRALRSLGG